MKASAGTIANKVNVTPDGGRLAEKLQLQHSAIKFDRSNKFDLCYYGQINSLRLKSSVASKWASTYLWGSVLCTPLWGYVGVHDIVCPLLQIVASLL